MQKKTGAKRRMHFTPLGLRGRAPVSDIGPDRARQGKFGPVAAAARPIGRGRRRHRSAGGRPMRAPCVSRTMILAPARHTINSNECCYHILCTAFRTGSGFWTAAPWFDKDSQVLRAIMGGISTAGGMCRADGNLCRCPSGTEFRHQFPAARLTAAAAGCPPPHFVSPSARRSARWGPFLFLLPSPRRLPGLLSA